MTPEIAVVVAEAVRSKVAGLGGTLLAVGNADDHVHMVVTIPPRISVASFVGQVKGVSSGRVNKTGLSSVRFYWEEEYGVFTVSERQLPTCIAYVCGQRAHHATSSTVAEYERSDSRQPVVQEGELGKAHDAGKPASAGAAQ